MMHNVDVCIPFRPHIGAALFSVQEPADIFFVSISPCLKFSHPCNFFILLPLGYIIIYTVFLFSHAEA